MVHAQSDSVQVSAPAHPAQAGGKTEYGLVGNAVPLAFQGKIEIMPRGYPTAAGGEAVTRRGREQQSLSRLPCRSLP